MKVLCVNGYEGYINLKVKCMWMFERDLVVIILALERSDVTKEGYGDFKYDRLVDAISMRWRWIVEEEYF
jgi:hypothetical protein